MSRNPKTTTAPTGSIAPFGLRMLPELKERLEEAARASGRSMNAEIVHRLQQSFVSLIPPASDKWGMTAEGELSGGSAAEPSEVELLSRKIDLMEAVAQKIYAAMERGDLFKAPLPPAPVAPYEPVTEIPVTVRGRKVVIKRQPAPMVDPGEPVDPGQREGSVVLVGNIGRDYVGGHLTPQEAHDLTAKPPPNKGPTRSPNTRKPKP